MRFLLPLFVVIAVYLGRSWAALPRITLADIPYYKFPCSGNQSEFTEHHRERCKSKFSQYGFGRRGLGYNRQNKNNNVYCRVFRLCLNFSFGNLYLTAYGFWRGQGLYPAKNYNIHALGGAKVEGAVEVQRPRVDALKNAISIIRRKASGDNLSLGLKDPSDAEKIRKGDKDRDETSEEKEVELTFSVSGMLYLQRTCPSVCRRLIFETMPWSEVMLTERRGMNIPSFFAVIDQMYSDGPNESILREDNLTKDELEILELHAADFLAILYAKFALYGKFRFKWLYESVQVRDHFLLKGMRTYRLEFLPVVMNSVSVTQRRRIATTIPLHLEFETRMIRKVSSKWNVDDQIARFFRYERSYGWEYRTKPDASLEDQYMLSD